MNARVRSQLRAILDDAENVATGLSLAYHRHSMSAHAYAAGLAATYLTAIERVEAIVVEVES